MVAVRRSGERKRELAHVPFEAEEACRRPLAGAKKLMFKIPQLVLGYFVMIEI